MDQDQTCAAPPKHGLGRDIRGWWLVVGLRFLGTCYAVARRSRRMDHKYEYGAFKGFLTNARIKNWLLDGKAYHEQVCLGNVSVM